jgi:hypothetical protein
MPLQSITAAELATLTLPRQAEVIEGLLPEIGLALLYGRPKVGKSWMLLQIAIAVASGFKLFAKRTTIRKEVLLLALEDNRRRLQARLAKMLSGMKHPANLHLGTECNCHDKGGKEDLRSWMEQHKGNWLTIIDTWVRYKPSKFTPGREYEDETSQGAELQALANQYGGAVILAHHSRKMQSEDPFDDAHKSTGLAGAADTLLSLRRRRGQNEATLWATGRDIEEQSLAFKHGKDTGRWLEVGESSQLAATREQEEVLQFMRTKEGGVVTPKELAMELEIPEPRARQRLHRLSNAGKLVCVKYGKYALPEQQEK